MSIKYRLSIALGLALVCALMISSQINLPSSETLRIIKYAKDYPEVGALGFDRDLQGSIDRQYLRISALVFLALGIPMAGIVTLPALIKSRPWAPSRPR
jgi:hypothetical protein